MNKIIPLIFSFYSFFSFSQNLVPNPSFEDTVACPNQFSQLQKAVSWSSYRPTPDYFHSCSFSSDVSVPQNNMGYQFPAYNVCNGYAGIYTYIQGSNYRECIGTQLLTSLIIGQKYYLSFKVSLANSINCSTNKIGILFSTIAFNDSTPVPINNFAHVYSNQIITDTANWVSVVGSFVADSSYQYIIIGNFFDNINTDTIKFNTLNCTSYYFIDDVCVSLDSATCTPFSFICNTGLSESEKDEEDLITIYPNPDNKNIIIKIKKNNVENTEMKIYNLFGKEVKKIFVVNQEIVIEKDDLPNGIYIIQLQISNKIINQKFIFTN